MFHRGNLHKLKILYFVNIYCITINIMDNILTKFTKFINPDDSHSSNGSVTNTSSNKVAAVNGIGNKQFGGPCNSAKALNSNPGFTYTNSAPRGYMMSGGGRSRRHKRSSGSKKYARKRSLRYRLKHKKSGKRKHRHTKRRGQRGGYAQYLTNQAFTLGQRLPGFPLLPNESALANPPPFMPYRNCPGGM